MHFARSLFAGIAALWLGGCSLTRVPFLVDAGTEPPLERPERAYLSPPERVDVFGALPPEPSGTIETPGAAIAAALQDAGLVEHMRRMDADYAGRRNQRLEWMARAQREAEQDGEAYWRVELKTEIRRSTTFYACELRIAVSGRNLTPFSETERTCRWVR